LLKETLVEAFRGIDVAFYLVHSMTAGEQEFEKRDRIAALNVADVASTAGLQRLIYLGGLGKRESVQSAHLRSRHEVGEILRKGSYQLLLLRAEMKVWGEARLEFRTHETGPNNSLLIQTARYYPKGLAGILYWYSVYPVHILVFRGLAKAVVRVAQSHAVVKQR